MRRFTWLLAIAAILLTAAYLASPLLAWNTLRDAARAGDERQMARVIDFPAVRGSLKGQLREMVAARIAADPRLKDNPFARFGLRVLPGLIDTMVDAYLTPHAIAVMVGQARAPSAPRDRPPGQAPQLQVHYAYAGLDRFKVTAAPKSHPDLPLTFVLARRRLFGWALVRIDLPPGVMR